ncbi:MAG: sulfite exporter TauE/SafE family protein [Burkholderiales bacterium]|jgi:sulfite exporter TauE/SafE
MGLDLGVVPLAGLFAAFFAALTTGFLGSLHCVSMCGATIASAMGNSRADLDKVGPITWSRRVSRGSSSARFALASSSGTMGVATSRATGTMRASTAFNAGRILSYVIAGALAAGVAGSLAERLVLNDMTPLRLLLYIFGQCLVIATGFYIAGVTKFLAPVERAGGWIWQRLQWWVAPRLQMHLRNGQARPFAFGALWGWIPCGLVYGTLATAISSGSVEGGALVMLGFGLGTLPAMFAVGAAAAPLRKFAQRARVRLAAGAIVIGMGLVGLSHATQLADFAALAQLCLRTI